MNRRGWRWCKRFNPEEIAKYEKHLRFLTNTSSCRAAFQSRKRTWKFGVQIPTSIKDAYLLDTENGNTKWANAIQKELFELKLYDSFRVLNQGEDAPEGYKHIPMHMVFDVKHDG